jgi:hypothetical protein
MLCEGHIEAVFCIFGYLKKRHSTWMVFNPTNPDIDMSRFKEEVNWKPKYGDMKEAFPDNAPEPHRKAVNIRVFLDADHAARGQDDKEMENIFLLFSLIMHLSFGI